MTDAQTLITRFDRLASERATLESNLEQVRELFYPEALPFNRRDTPGQKVHEKVFDSTPEQSAELLAAGLQAILTNPSSKWFNMAPANPSIADDEEAARWLEQSADLMYAVFNSPNTNFAPQQHEKYMDLVTFGNGVMYIADRPGRLPLFSTRPLAECFMSESDEGRIDTVFRKFEMTARNAVAQWGNGVSDQVKRMADDPQRMDVKGWYLHAVFPRKGFDPNKMDQRNMPFASVYVCLTGKKVIREGGYMEFPYTTPRWMKRAGEVYGRGPGMKALADARMLQRVMKVSIRGVEKMIDPPLIVADDGVMSPLRVTPSGINYVRWDMMSGSTSPIRPLETGGQPNLGDVFMQDIRQRIEAAFYTPLLQFARDPRMTATQVLQITEQVMQTMNPILGRMQVEDLGPLIDRVFGIMLRAGAFGEPPEVLQGQQIKVEYVSPVAKAQRLQEARAVTQLYESAAPLIQMDPTVQDNVDADETFRNLADVLGLRKDNMRPKELVSQMRQARQQVAEQQAQMAMAEQTVGMVDKGASALAKVAA